MNWCNLKTRKHSTTISFYLANANNSDQKYKKIDEI